MGQMTSTAWKNICGTWLLHLQQMHLCDWQDYHCLVAGVELDKCATGHEMPSQRREKLDLPMHKTNLVPLGKTGGYLQLRKFTSLRCTISM